MMVDIVAALPFLPRGKGGLILILGGMAAVFLAMLWLTVTDPASAPRRRARMAHASPAVHRRPTRPARPVPSSAHAGRPYAGPPPRTREAPYQGPAQTHVARGRQDLVHARAADPAFAADAHEAALRLGLGPVEVWGAQEERCALLVKGCRSCLRPGSTACEAERRAIEETVRIVHPRASVVESACQARGRGRCIFEVLRTGGP